MVEQSQGRHVSVVLAHWSRKILLMRRLLSTDSSLHLYNAKTLRLLMPVVAELSTAMP